MAELERALRRPATEPRPPLPGTDGLVSAAQAGDRDALERLFDVYRDPVHRYIAARVRCPMDAEDLTQQVFVKAFEALPRYQQRNVPFVGWLYRIARNAVIDHNRVASRRIHHDIDAMVDQVRPGPGPDEVAVERQEIDAVGRAMGRLTDEQRDAIALRFIDGLSCREAAEAMGKQEGTIRGLQFRGLAALRRGLGIDLSTS